MVCALPNFPISIRARVNSPLTHPDYTLPIANLTTLTGIPTIFYDQFGNGKSTHAADRKGDDALFTTALYKRELDNLIDHLQLRKKGFSLLGHSWGGMLAAMYATDHHASSGLHSIVISNSPAGMSHWQAAAAKLRAQMPDVDAILTKCEKEGRTEGDKEYDAAAMQFYKRHVCRVDPFPHAMNMALQRIEEDPTVYHTMNGPNEFYVVGNLKTWSVVEELRNIECEVLLLNGEYDEAADSTVQPFWEGIKRVRWRTLGGCSHMAFMEDEGRYLECVGGFLG